MRKYLIFNIALFTQFLPEIFSYSNDFFLLIYFIYLFVTKKILNKLIVSPLILILFLVTIKIIFSHNFPLFKQFFSDYRPFLVFGILYYTTFEIDAIPYRNKIFYFLIIIILLSIPNLIGMISQPYYSSILKYYYRYVIGGFENSDNTNIAQISSLNGRFSTSKYPHSVCSSPSKAFSKSGFIFSSVSIKNTYINPFISEPSRLYLLTNPTNFKSLSSGKTFITSLINYYTYLLKISYKLILLIEVAIVIMILFILK